MAHPAQNLARNFYAYISDDGTTYQIATTVENAGPSGASPVPPGTNPGYPRGWVVRHIYGVNDSDPTDRTKCPILDPTNGRWTGANATFSKNGATYTIEGRIGERRINRS